MLCHTTEAPPGYLQVWHGVALTVSPCAQEKSYFPYFGEWRSLQICLYCLQDIKFGSCMKFQLLAGGVLGHLAISQGMAEICVTIRPLSFHILEQMLYIMSISSFEESHKAHTDYLVTLFFWWPKPQGLMEHFHILRAVLVPSFGWPRAAQSSLEGTPVICNMLSSWGHVFIMIQQMND